MSTNLLPLWLASPSDVANVIPVHRLTKECRACAATAVQHGRKKPLGHGQLSSETFTSATCLMPHHLEEGVKMCWLNHSYSNSTGWMVRPDPMDGHRVCKEFWTDSSYSSHSSDIRSVWGEIFWIYDLHPRRIMKFIRAWRMMKLHRPWLRHRLSL